MEIADDLLEVKVKFEDLAEGDTFVYDEDDLFMKIKEIDSDTIQVTAVSLINGQPKHISDFEYVRIINAKVVRKI